MAAAKAVRRRKIAGAGTEYVSGNVVYIREEAEREPTLHELRMQRRARAIERRRSFTYMLFMTIAMVMAGGILTVYIFLQSQISSSVKSLSALEIQLNELRQENDEAYSRVHSNVDLEQVREIAIREYGMQYAGEGQIVGYTGGGGNDYVRQKAEIPDLPK